MSPKQFIIIGVSAAAALLSNSPLVTAIGSVAQHNTPTDDYPPMRSDSWFRFGTYLGTCNFGEDWEEEKTTKKSINIHIMDRQFHTHAARCPETATRPSFLISYRDDTKLHWYATGDSWEVSLPTVIFPRGPPENTGRDPLRELKYEGEDYSIADYCSTVIQAVGKLWTFKDLCNKFHEGYLAAMEAADREGWQKVPNKGINHTDYFPPRR